MLRVVMRLAPLLAVLLGQASAVAVTEKASTATKARSMVTRVVKATTFVKSLAFRQKLRVCNAYPSTSGMMLMKNKEDLTAGSAMAYKECREFTPELDAGDRLDFKVDETSAGSFKVNELPSHDAVLLLVIERHDTLSTSVSFESHVFASLQNAQLAIIDTYKGAATSTPAIRDAEGSKAATERSEKLRYDSVVAVNPGLYEVVLEGQNAEVKARSALVALNHESYVVLRTGVEAQRGDSFPQEIVVYPRSKVSDLHGGAAKAGLSGLLVAAIAMVATTLSA